MPAIVNPSRIGAAEEKFCQEMAISGETIAAYKAAGYPTKDSNGKPLNDVAILKRSRTVAQLPIIKEHTAELRKQYTKGAVTEWTREEIVDGYRAIYNAASKHIIDEKRDDAGEVVQSKFNDRAATIAISVLEKITRIYGYDAPVKVDGTVTFKWDALQPATSDSAALLTQGYDYTGEVTKPAQNASGEVTDGNIQDNVQSPSDISQYAV